MMEEKVSQNIIILKQHNPNPAADYEISLLEKNILSIVMSKFRDCGDPSKTEFFISIQEIKKKLKEIEQEVTLTDIELATDQIFSRVYRFFDWTGKFVVMSIFASVIYVDGSDLIKVEIFSDVKQFMLEYDFTTYSGWSVLRLRSIYAKHIYQFLVEHKESGVFKILIQELRERLNLSRESNKLNNWRAFEKTVLRTSQKEINEKTELRINYTLKKTGLKYTDLEFHIEKKEGM